MHLRAAACFVGAAGKPRLACGLTASASKSACSSGTPSGRLGVYIGPWCCPQGEQSVPQFETILYDVQDGIATISLNRPERMNAFTYGMMGDLLAAFDASDADDQVRAVIVTGAGDRAFCAGADLGSGQKTFDFASRSDQGKRPRVNGVYPDSGGRVALRMFDSLKPIVGAINGAAVGFGASFILPMDIRIASEGARFGYVYARRGIVPESACAWFLPRVVGITTALEWCYSGRLVGAREALERGLVRSVHPPQQLLEAARALAVELMSRSAPVSLALTRQMLWRMLGADHPIEAHKIDSRGVMTRGRSADAKEGVSSFAEKRTAEFPDRVTRDMPEFFPWWPQRRFE
jgi:enoyl-CoA hydratase/carnithine racemase